MALDFPDPHAAHEAKIRAAMDAYLACTDEVEKINLWGEFLKLHAQRSPEMVKRMEQTKGLL